MEEEIIYDPILERNQMIQSMIDGLSNNPTSISIKYNNKVIGITPDLLDMVSVIEYLKNKLTESINA
jgi:hypothetical protein